MSTNVIDSDSTSMPTPQAPRAKGARKSRKKAKPAKKAAPAKKTKAARAKPAAQPKVDRTNKKAEVIAMVTRTRRFQHIGE